MVSNNMQNALELKANSLRLYKYLCDEIVGSENIVRYKRLYCKLHDDVLNYYDSEIISSGSKAEGLDIPGSDIDMMLLLKTWEAHESKPDNKKEVIILDTENALPGFALLKVTDDVSFIFLPTITVQGNIIASDDFLDYISTKEELNDALSEIHGPSLSHSFFSEIDIVPCLKCHTWPSVAKQWLLRYRPSGWPSHDIICKVVTEGVLLVPVGSKSSSSEGNPLEWRFSFSLSEKLLASSLNHCQFLCYSLLKIFLKQILNKINRVSDKLCSYHMKTVLFWVLEEDQHLCWIQENLLQCFLSCIQRLHYWISCEYIPNYFIPEHNMLDGKLSHDVLSYLSLLLDDMNKPNSWKIIFSAPSLSNLKHKPNSILKELPLLSELDAAVRPLHTFSAIALVLSGYYRKDSQCRRIIYRILQKNLPYSAKRMLTTMFLQGNKTMLATFDVLNGKNKCRYLLYKRCLSRILINTYYNIVSGWLLLGAFFYSTKEYQKMFYILQLSSSLLSLKNNRISKVEANDAIGFCSEKFQFLTEDFPYTMKFESYQSNTLFYYLKFLYSREQGKSLETRSALQLLRRAILKDINT
ncbi:uncharacterized protein LOC134694746 [Mytilus trossulus]|uniref:uncharacterized protein LOC134694746 n=1 Tax=Mytilus trossulus TaxID=6551 RepID=UPI003007320D